MYMVMGRSRSRVKVKLRFIRACFIGGTEIYSQPAVRLIVLWFLGSSRRIMYES